ncbi:GNAT family N-acetyltransferase [Candidatus Formimonas warabiya]|uniref:GNAT family N-acetyltransferase n=1 Tax=Formimonas warabiya TaxID=1761012 RepID=A0A3G1L2P1_FORW1|nr:GNAT family N-acetyltransferase [Candidatus Formimonas warabiya]ATW28930.1 GNAT family N-acetyltransferase [Candidatus Formimonas warabiya]
MTRKDVDLAVEWAAAEGWNPGYHDAECFYAADPQGFFLGEWDGQPVGCISAVSYGPAYGFLGFYIVKPEYRGKGLGLKLWQTALHYLKGRTIGLDGVLAQQDNYADSGFQLAYRNIRFSGRCGDFQTGKVSDLTQVPFADVVEYDRKMFGVPRPRFLQAWIGQPGSSSRAVLAQGKLAGYGVLRPCAQGYKIGPLFAEDEETADQLFCALAARVPGADVVLDVPELNIPAVNLAERYHLQPVFETARMYYGQPPLLPLHKIFGVTSFELG